MFGVCDDQKHNANLFITIKNIFTVAGIDIPDVAIEDVFRLGKIQQNRPIKIKFISALGQSML